MVQTPAVTTEEQSPKLYLEDITARIELMPAPMVAAATPNSDSAETAFMSLPEEGLRTHGRLDITRCVTGMVRDTPAFFWLVSSVEDCLTCGMLVSPSKQ